MLGVAHRQMAREAVIEPVQRERAACADEALFQVLPVLRVVLERGQLRKDQALLLGLIGCRLRRDRQGVGIETRPLRSIAFDGASITSDMSAPFEHVDIR
jgi:hypothetical protein